MSDPGSVFDQYTARTPAPSAEKPVSSPLRRTKRQTLRWYAFHRAMRAVYGMTALVTCGYLLYWQAWPVARQWLAPDPETTVVYVTATPTPSRSVATFEGIGPVSVEQGGSFDPMAGVSARVGESDVTSAVSVTGDVNLDEVGQYTLTYRVQGEDLEPLTAQRLITVTAAEEEEESVPTEAPELEPAPPAAPKPSPKPAPKPSLKPAPKPEPQPAPTKAPAPKPAPKPAPALATTSITVTCTGDGGHVTFSASGGGNVRVNPSSTVFIPGGSSRTATASANGWVNVSFTWKGASASSSCSG